MEKLHNPNSLYILPFNPEKVELERIIHESDSHQGKYKNAIDFCMPENTEIIAAQSGIIVDIITSHKEGKNDPAYADKTNYIQILHDDGTIAEYLHLLYQEDPLLKKGEKVEQGTSIALSGNTGYSSETHLHFLVAKEKSPGNWEGIPVNFKNWNKIRLKN